jgi:hypothetical protein
VIGILLHNQDKTIVEEFFQLFKTPWEYYQAHRPYRVIITDQKDPAGLHAPLLIILLHAPGALTLKNDPAQNGSPPVELRQSQGPEFPIYAGVAKISGGTPILEVKSNRQPAGSRAATAGQTTLRLGYDFFEEVKYILLHGQPLSQAHVPTLDIHILNLRNWILDAGLHLIEIPPHPNGSPFFACLTHDVDFAGIKNHLFDHTMAGFLHRAIIVTAFGFIRGRYPLSHLVRNWLAVAALPLILVGLKKDFWYQFKNYIKIEKECPSTFYLVPFKNNPGKAQDGTDNARRAVKYEVAALEDEIDLLLKNGCEVGIHGLDGWHQVTAAVEELKKIQTLTGKTDLGVRMHWLYNSLKTPCVLEQAGYKYDSTWGYNETPGCRAGTFQVYKPPEAQSLLELPMHVMDTALFYPDRMNLTFDQGIEAIKSFADSVAIHGGVLTLNWHHRSIAPERLWDGVYRDALDELRSRNARFATATDIVDWFEKRRSITFETVEFGPSSIKVALCASDQPIEVVDDLVLRIHAPRSQDANFRDTTMHEYPILNHQVELRHP